MSKTGDALEALYAALVAKASEPSPAIPMPLQNEDLPARLVAVGAGGSTMLLNVWDDNEDEGSDEQLGADEHPGRFDVLLSVPIEFAVMNKDRAARRAAFEAGLEAIDDAVKADRTLGGTVDDVRLLAPRRSGSGLITDGMPEVLAADMRVLLLFTSSRTF